MLFDSLMMAAIGAELTHSLQASRIRRVFGLRPGEVALESSTNRAWPLVVLSADAQFGRIHLSSQAHPQPDFHCPFADVLRRHLRGATLQRVEQIDFDRQLHLHFVNCQELGAQARCTLVAEIMGRYSNLLLLDEAGIILDCIKHVTSDVNRYRQSLPGLQYVPPPQFNKSNPLDVSAEDFLLTAQPTAADMSFAQWFRNHYHGASNLLLAELAARANWSPETPVSRLPAGWPQQLHRALHELTQAAATGGVGYVCTEPAETTPAFAYPVIPASRPDMSITQLPSLSAAIEQVADAQRTGHRMGQQRQRLRESAQRRLQQVASRRQSQQQALEQAQCAPRYRQWGELILAHLAQISPGASEITVPNYYQEGQPPITIKLSPDRDPTESAQHYFRRYKRYRRMQKRLPDLIRQGRREEQYLEGLLHQIQIADSAVDLAELEQEMIAADYLSPPRRRRPPARRKLPRFVTQAGYTVIYGKTGLQNDRVLRKADGEDIWLHVRQGPGAHVVIRTGGQPDSVPESSLLQAAGHAAALSKQSQGTAVEVSYTLVKHVRKPKGSPPGFVHYTNFQTLRVRPQLATTHSQG